MASPVAAAVMPVMVVAPMPIVMASGMPSMMAPVMPAVAAIPMIAGMHAAMGAAVPVVVMAPMPIMVVAAMPVVAMVGVLRLGRARKRHRCDQRCNDDGGRGQESLVSPMHVILRYASDATSIVPRR